MSTLDHFTARQIRSFLSRYRVGEASGCWLWTGGKNPSNGYGRVARSSQLGRKRHEYVHRVFYELHHGDIPAGHLVRHRCDVRLCVNPAHLLTGTHEDNMADAVERNRTPGGERHYATKLSNADAVAIVDLRCEGLMYHVIAERYGISPKVVGKIIRGERWSRVTGIERAA